MSGTRSVLMLLLLLCSAALIGCNIAGPIYAVVAGPPTVEAEYVLTDRPTVVFVDDRSNTIGSNARVMRAAIADKVAEDLMVKEVIAPENMISPRDAMGIVGREDRHSSLMPIDAIGRAVGAEQIIYIEMAAFTSSPDGAIPRPTSACRVRVIDVPQRQRLFPAADSGEASRALQASTTEIDPALLRSPSSRLKVFQALAEETGEQIAKLFYKHAIKELGENLNPR